MVTRNSYPLSKLNVPTQLAVWSGMTSAAGAALGTSIIDAALIGSQDFLAGKSILILSGTAQFEVRNVSSFNNVTGEIIVTAAYTDTAGAPVQIPALTAYSVINSTTGIFHFPQIIDLWSVYQNQVSLTTVAGDKALPDITIAGIPTGATILRAIMMFKARNIENTNAAVNSCSGAQNIQCQKAVAGAYINAIGVLAAGFGLPATTREGGDVLIGSLDISAQVPANAAVMNFRWLQGLAAQNNLNFNDVQVGIRIFVTV